MLAGKISERLQKHVEAHNYYTRILKDIDGTSVQALLGVARTGWRIGKEEDIIPRLHRLVPPEVQQIDVEALELADISVVMRPGPVKRGAVAAKQAKGDTSNTGTEKKKRQRKPKYPKGFDPENPGPHPDPERWLPKHQRAAYKKLHKKKERARGPQGAMPTSDSSNISKLGPSTAQVDTAQDTSRRRGGKQRRKHRT